MKNSIISLILLTPMLQLLWCTQITSSLKNLSNCKIPSSLDKSCTCENSLEGISLTCLGLNSTRDFTQLEPDIARSVIKLDISRGFIPCVELQDLSSLTRLKELRLTNSKVKEALCAKSKVRHKKAVQKLKHLLTLDLSHNSLARVDDSLIALYKLQTINLSNNYITHIQPIFSAFKKLDSLDISNNKLSANFNKQVFKEMSPSLKNLDISGINYKNMLFKRSQSLNGH